MSGTTTRVRGLAPWTPRRATVDLLSKVNAVLTEYFEYLPLTIRQIFYRLVGAHGFDKTERSYARLGEHLNRARRAGLIDFDAIRDDGTTLTEPRAWDDAAEMLRALIVTAESYRLDRQQGQPVRLMFAVEAAGMVPQVERIADRFGIAVHSSGGFDSVTAKHALATDLGRWPRVEVFHVGDHDPSGVHLFSSMAEDVKAIARDLGLKGEITFTRLAVTQRQIGEMGLPTAPAKATDRRSFDGETVQVEAIPPDVLANIITEAINSRLDVIAYRAVLAQEKRAVAQFHEALIPELRRIGGGT
jgi:hypothetical protein